ncbi:unnamed protein product [marine sediment metagenome]|uniref:SIS domain-containing protein n=1 Tax=marine sediment metagenome TaxID=412755 RepID=X1FJV4_9ZZZZ
MDVGELERAAKAISHARKVDFYGVGASGFVALDAQNKFLRINIESMAKLIENSVQKPKIATQ